MYQFQSLAFLKLIELISVTDLNELVEPVNEHDNLTEVKELTRVRTRVLTRVGTPVGTQVRSLGLSSTEIELMV